jgi:hypothetical protein
MGRYRIQSNVHFRVTCTAIPKQLPGVDADTGPTVRNSCPDSTGRYHHSTNGYGHARRARARPRLGLAGPLHARPVTGAGDSRRPRSEMIMIRHSVTADAGVYNRAESLKGVINQTQPFFPKSHHVGPAPARRSAGPGASWPGTPPGPLGCQCSDRGRDESRARQPGRQSLDPIPRPQWLDWHSESHSNNIVGCELEPGYHRTWNFKLEQSWNWTRSGRGPGRAVRTQRSGHHQWNL